jgi:hypothetical protein
MKNILKKIFYIKNLLLLIVGLITFYPLFSTGLVVNDDMLNKYIIYKNGFIKTFLMSIDFCKAQGRVFFVSFFWTYLPFAIKNFAYFKFIQIGSIILNITLISILATLITDNKKSFFLTFLIGLVFLQNSWEHNVVSAFPGFLTIPLSILIFSMILFIYYFKKNNKKYLWLSLIFYILTLFSYEIYILFLPIFFFIALGYEKKLLKVIKKFLPFIITGFIYLLIYVLFRLKFGSYYGGVQIQKSFNLINALKVIWYFSFSSFPLFLVNTEKYRYLMTIYNDSLYRLDLLTAKYLFFSGINFFNFLKSIQVQWLVKGIIVFYLSYVSISNAKTKKNNLFFPIVLGVVYFFIPSFLHSLTQSYQDSVVKYQQLGMPVTYVSYIDIILTFSLIVIYFRNKINNKSVLKIFIIVISSTLFLVSIINDYTNFQIAKYQTMAKYKWETVDRFIKSKEFNEVPENSTIYAPSLWYQIGSAAFNQSYWTDYITYQTNKKVNVVEFFDTSEKYKQLYFLKYDQKEKDFDQSIIFAKVNKYSGPDNLITEKICVYNFSKYNDYYIIGRSVDKDITIKDELNSNSYFSLLISNNYNYENDLKKTCFRKSYLDINSFFIVNGTNNNIKIPLQNDLIIRD